MDTEVIDLANLIEMAEGGEGGGSARSPMLLLEETQFYFNIRAIVLGEKGRVSAWKRKNDNKRKR